MAYRFNPFTGNLSPVGEGGGGGGGITEEEVRILILEYLNRIATTDRNALGNLNFFYDPVACKWVEAGYQLVTDEDGNVVIEDEP